MDQHSLAAAEPTQPEPANPADPYLRRAQTFPALTASQVDRATAFGKPEAHPPGTLLFQRGDRGVDFFLVLDGAIEIFDEDPEGESRVFNVHGERQFTGELDQFNEREILVGGRIGPSGATVLRIPRRQFRRLLAAEPDIAETILRAYILRRTGLIQHAQGAVDLIVSANRESVGDQLRIQRFLGRNGYPVRPIEAESEEGGALLLRHGLTEADAPVALCSPGAVLRNPSNRLLGRCLGITEEPESGVVYDVAVVGAGPAGLAAAVYAASEGLRTVVVEGEAPGGQAGTSSMIENYLGFPTGISGGALAARAQVQAQKFGARIVVPRSCVALLPGPDHHTLELEEGERLEARCIILAMGARYRRLDLPGTERFEGSFIHYAATAVEASVCSGEEVVVIGGGNSAGQAAAFLSRRAARVHMLVRGDQLAASMSTYLVGRIEATDRIGLLTRTELVALDGERHLESATWIDRRTGRTETRAVSHVFLMLGAVPNTEWLQGSGVALDRQGFVRVGEPGPGDPNPRLLESSVRRVFAVGDVRANSVKRVASAVGEGSVVVASVHAAMVEEAV